MKKVSDPNLLAQLDGSQEASLVPSTRDAFAEPEFLGPAPTPRPAPAAPRARKRVENPDTLAALEGDETGPDPYRALIGDVTAIARPNSRVFPPLRAEVTDQPMANNERYRQMQNAQRDVTGAVGSGLETDPYRAASFAPTSDEDVYNRAPVGSFVQLQDGSIVQRDVGLLEGTARGLQRGYNALTELPDRIANTFAADALAGDTSTEVAPGKYGSNPLPGMDNLVDSLVQAFGGGPLPRTEPVIDESTPEGMAEVVRRSLPIAQEEARLARTGDIANRGLEPSLAAEEFFKQKDFGSAIRALAEDPIGIITPVAAESLVQFSPALATMLVTRSPGAAMTASGVTSGALEYANGISGRLMSMGIDPADEAKVAAALGDPAILREIMADTKARAAVIGAADALSAGIATRTLAPARLSLGKREAANVAAQVAQGGALGGAGEVGGTAVTGDEQNASNVLAEIFAEGVTAPVEAVASGSRVKAINNADTSNAADVMAALEGLGLTTAPEDLVAGLGRTTEQPAAPAPSAPVAETASMSEAEPAPPAPAAPTRRTPAEVGTVIDKRLAELQATAVGRLEPEAIQALDKERAQLEQLLKDQRKNQNPNPTIEEGRRFNRGPGVMTPEEITIANQRVEEIGRLQEGHKAALKAESQRTRLQNRLDRIDNDTDLEAVAEAISPFTQPASTPTEASPSSLTEGSRRENEDGSTTVNYKIGDKGHAQVRINGKSAHITDVQIGYEGKSGRGTGLGTKAYQELGEQLSAQGIVLQSTRWDSHQAAISPTALAIWAKLERAGLATKTGVEVGKVYDRETGLEEVREIPTYDFVSTPAAGIAANPESRSVEAEGKEGSREEAGQEGQGRAEGEGAGGVPVEAQADQQGPLNPEAPAPAGVPVMITQAMKAQLLNRGYSREQIAGMKPQLAQDILAELNPRAPDQAPVATDPDNPLSPRAPAPVAAPQGKTRAELAQAVQDAKTPGERSAAAAAVAAFDAENPTASRSQAERTDPVRTGDTDADVTDALVPDVAKRVKIARRKADIPDDVRERNGVDKPENANAEGFYDKETGEGWVIEENLQVTQGWNRRDRKVWVAAHEVAGHRGMRAVIAKKGGQFGAEFTTYMDRAEQNPTVKAIAEKIASEYKAQGVSISRARVVEEALAELGAAVRTGNYDAIARRYKVTVTPQNRTTIKGLIENLIRAARRAFGFSNSVPDSEIYKLIEDAYKAAGKDAFAAPSGGGMVAQRVYNGGPARDVERMSLSKIGTGAGNKLYGWGLYFANMQEVADMYRRGSSAIERRPGGDLADELLQKYGGDRVRAIEDLKRRGNSRTSTEGKREIEGAIAFIRADNNRGQVYAVDIPEDSELVNWDRRISTLSDELQTKVRDAVENAGLEYQDKLGADVYRDLEQALGSDRAASEALDAVGIPGLKYMDGQSRNIGQPVQYNYVIWNEGAIGTPEPLIASRKAVADKRFAGMTPDQVKATSKLLQNLTPDERERVGRASALKIIAQLEKMPDKKEMAATAIAGQAKRGWYAQSARTISDVFGVDGPRFALLLAATSPQTSVQSNLRNTLNIWNNWNAAGRPTDREAIIDVMGASVEGGRGRDSVLDAWINNSVRALTGDPNTTVLSGPKVNSFFRNLVGDVNEVTNDAWMASYALVNQTIFKGSLSADGTNPGKSPGYLAMNARVRETAAYLTKLTGETWTPAEVQETVWSWAKTVYEAAGAAGEISTAAELVLDGAITDAMIADTPDFGTLFTQPEYAGILEEAGYGEQVQQLRVDRDPGQEDGGRPQPARGRENSPLGEDAQRRLEGRSARRLDALRRQRLDAEREGLKERGIPEDEDVPFSRRAFAADVYGVNAGTDLVGLPSIVTVPGMGKVAFHTFKPAQDVANAYMAARGLGPAPTTYVKVDPERAARIAAAYEKAEHSPQDPEVKAAYRAMIDETLAQYREVLKTGLTIEFIEGEDPYAASPRMAILDVVENNHLWVFPTTDGFGSSALDVSDNPLLEETAFEISGRKALANDIFRVVHDYFGHIKDGVGFRADGEENAWRSHSAMYSPLARRAMTSETRGQNSWVNYGPNGKANQTATSADTVYADQKTVLLPEWVSEDGAAETIASRPSFNAKPVQPGAVTVVGVHYSSTAGRTELDPSKAGMGAAGAERRRFGMDNFGKQGGTAARLAFYVWEDGQPLPKAEDAVLAKGRDKPYAVRLTNLYDWDNDPLDIVSMNVDATEEEISDAGFDGFVKTGPGGGIDGRVAVVYDIGKKNIPVAAAEEMVASRGRPRAFDSKAYGQAVIPAARKAFDSLSYKAQGAIEGFQRGVFSSGNMIEADPVIQAEIETAFAPVREALRSAFGDTVRLYRAQDRNPTGERSLFSWSFDPATRSGSGDFMPPMYPIRSEEEIESLVAKLRDRGHVTIDGNRYVRSNKWPEAGDDYFMIYDRDGNVVTDAVGLGQVRSSMQWDNDFGNEQNAKRSSRKAMYAADVPVEQILFVMPNALSTEAVVRRDPAAEGDEIIASRRTPQMAQQQRATMLGRLAASGFPLGSPTQQGPGGRFAPLMESADLLRRKLQDKMLPVLRAQEAVDPTSSPGVTSLTLADAMNAYRMENLMYGRTKDRIEKADRDFVLKLQTQMKRLGVSIEQLEDYLLARHAAERNARIAAINQAKPDSGSGISTQQAADILAGNAPGVYSGKVLSPETLRNAAALAVTVDAMRDATLANLIESGQLTPALVQALKSRYQAYIPLRGLQGVEDSATGRGTGRGLNVIGRGIQRALGRSQGSYAQNILGEMVGDLQRSIVSAEKSKVAQAFLRFALANPQPGVYSVEPVDLEWKWSDATGEAYLGVRNNAEDADTTLIVQHNGAPVRIRFDDPTLAEAMINLDAPELGVVLRTMSAINRWRSAVLTRFNPGFAPVNLVRDFQFGMAAAMTELGPKLGAEVVAGYLPAMRAMWRDARNKPGNAAATNKTWDDWAREFAEAGGKTGLTQVDDVVDLQRQMVAGSTTLLRLAAEGKPITLAKESIKRAGLPILNAIEDFNDATENAIRLSAYVARRKDGDSVPRAAEYAKNMTINFNRKGNLGPTLNAIYLFFNAAVQGTHAVVRVLRRPGVQAFLVGMAGLQAMMAASMMDDDDEDGITSWDKVPDYVKRTSLVIPLGFKTGNPDDYFALPMPYGFNVFPYAGGRLMQYNRFGKRDTDASVVSDLAKSSTEAFSPLPLTDGGNALFGDLMGFMMGLYGNTDDFGNPIVNDKFAPEGTPKALLGRPETPQAYHAVARFMAAAGGGDLENLIAPVGPLDVAPEQLEAVVDYMAGGLGSLANTSVKWWEQMSAGNIQTAMDSISATPIAKRFVATARDDRAVAERYYGEAGEFRRHKEILENRLRGAAPEDYQAIIDEYAKGYPVMAGMEVQKYRRNGTRPDGTKYKVGQVKPGAEGLPRLQAGADAVADALKKSEKFVKDQNKIIRALRVEGRTLAEVVDIIENNTNQELFPEYVARSDKKTDTRPAYERLGLPANFQADAVAPSRIRNRAIKLLQENRTEAQRGFLQTVYDFRQPIEEEGDE